MTSLHRTVTKFALAPLALALAALGGCEDARGWTSSSPPVHLVLDMDFQPKVRAQSHSDFEGWEDHRGARRPVHDFFGNTLVVSTAPLPDPKLAPRDANNNPVANPLPLTHKFTVRGAEMSTIDRGHECFEIHCAPCHGLSGQGGNDPKQGHGLVGRRWPVVIPNFHARPDGDAATNRVANLADGEFFEVITNGKGTMPAYGARLSVEERWAVVHYIRALQQLSR